MTVGDLEEAIGILKVLLTALLGTLSGEVGRQGAELRYAVGDLGANAASLLQAGTIFTPLWTCFENAFAAGATVPAFEVVRSIMLAQAPVSLTATEVVNRAIQMALAEEVKILAGTTFSSSQDVFAALAALNSAFDQAEEFAADNRDPSTYQALIAAHATATADLTTRAAYLPALVTYSYSRVLTSHALANSLYGEASRCDEIRAENKIIHPAFCPPSGTALSQ